MLDQKLIRENPTFVEKFLSLRGKGFEISHINKLTIQKKEIDIEISTLQSESKKLSKLIGQEIRNSNNPNTQELNKLKDKGNKYRNKISELVPLSRTAKEQIDLLKEWTSTGRARSAS